MERIPFYIFANFLPISGRAWKCIRQFYKPFEFLPLKARGIGIGLVVALFRCKFSFPFHQGLLPISMAWGDL